MTYTPIAKGTTNWDVPLNAALAQLDANITSASGDALQAANNLSDLTNTAQARSNLGLTGLANAFSNMNAVTNPAVTSDNTQGYSIGSTWFNTATNAMFVATNVSTGAAIWLQIPPTFVDRTTSQTIAGVKTFTSQINISQSGDTNGISASYSALNGANAAFAHNAFGTTARTIDARIPGDTFGRIAIFANGNMEWGPGTSNRDTNLYRAAPNLLQTDDSLSVLGTITGSVTTTGSVTPAANFTLNTATIRQTCGITFFNVVLNYTGTTITADSAGNIGDTLCATLSPAPPAAIITAFDKSGIASGTTSIATNGQVLLKTLSPTATIASGNSINFTAMWL